MFGTGRSYSYSEGTRRRTRSPARSTRSTRSVRSTHSSRGYFVRPAASKASHSSFFGGGGSSRGWGLGGGGSSSYYRRSPRQGYISYLWHKLRRMLRDLWHYAQRHPLKTFVAVVVPLLSAGGAMSGLLAQFGVRLPALFEGASSSSSSRRRGGGYYGSAGYGGGGDASGLMENLGPVMQVARALL